MKTVDFTDIDLYPKSYRCIVKNGRRTFAIKSLMIEAIDRQQKKLLAKKTQLLLGDYIKVDFKFGHNIGVEEETWLDVYISGLYKVVGIIPRNNEIELIVKYKKS